MNIKLMILSSFCLISFTTLALAQNRSHSDGGYSSSYSNSGYSSSYSNGGYSSSPSSSGYEVNSRQHNPNFSFSVSLPNGGVISSAPVLFPRHHRGPGIDWVNVTEGSPLPEDIVVGGDQPNPPAALYVCRIYYNGGLHPGKLYEGRCNIGWGGREVSFPHSQVLVSRSRLHWVSANHGYIPVNAIRGGYENGHPLYICQAAYRRGMHVGKVVGDMCNIGWGGEEISIPYYNVLVR